MIGQRAEPTAAGSHDCPPDQTLRRFATGDLPPDHREAIARHLETCVLCGRRLAAFDDQADPLLRFLRGEVLAGARDATDGLAGAPAPGGADPPGAGAGVPGGSAERYVSQVFHRRGGLGEVWVAHDVTLRREVAVKRIRPDRSCDLALEARFVREAEITGQLEHPGIVPVYDLRRDAEGRPSYVMRLVRGESLQDAIRCFHAKRGPGSPGAGDPGRGAGKPAAFASLAFRQLLGRFVSVCNTIAYAHSRKVIHRDLKPPNILLGPYGETLVVDWGLAKVLGTADAAGSDVLPPTGSPESEAVCTLDGAAVGTPVYMSPEQAGGRHDVGAASDVYSLGATLYGLLTGRPPFDPRENSSAVIEQVKAGRFPAPRAVERAVPRALEAVCLRAMATSPADRYPSAGALAADLERWLADEPVSGWREPFADRAFRWLRRRRAAVVPGALAACAVLVALAVVLAQREWVNRQLDAKNVALTAANEKAGEAQAHAERRLDLATRAVTRFQTVVEDRVDLRLQPSLGRALLVQPLEFYRELNQDLLRSRSATRAEYEQLVGSMRNYANLTKAIDSPARAVAIVRESLAALDRWRADPSSGGFAIPHQVEAQTALGALLLETGDLAGSRTAWTDALALTVPVERDSGNPAPVRRLKAYVLLSLASLDEAEGQPARARERTALARALLDQLPRSSADSSNEWEIVCTNHLKLGVLAQRQGHRAKAFEHYENLKTWCDQRLAIDPKSPRFRFLLAQAQYQIGRLRLSGRAGTGTAADSFAAAAGILERLVAEDPSVVSHRRILMNALGNLAVILQQRQPTEAIAAFERVRALNQALVQEIPQNVHLRSDLGITYHNIAVSYLKLKDVEHASELFRKAADEQAIAVSIAPGNLQYRELLHGHFLQLSGTLRDLGRIGDALETTRERRQFAAGDPEQLFLAACEFADCIAAARDLSLSDLTRIGPRRQECTRLALDTLREAARAGLQGAARVRDEPALEPVRHLPEFQAIHLELLDADFPDSPFLTTRG